MSRPKVSFAQGLANLERLGGKAPRSPVTEPVSDTPLVEPARAGQGVSSRTGKVSIAGYFDPAVRKQLAMLAVEQDTDQVKLMAEALNLLFEKHGRSPIA